MRRDWTRLRLLGLLSPSTAAKPLVTVEEAIGCEACRRAKNWTVRAVDLSHGLPELEERPV